MISAFIKNQSFWSFRFLFTKKSLFIHHEKDLFVKSPTHTVSSTIFRKTTEAVALFNFYTVLRSHCAKHRLKFHETRQTSSKKKKLTDTNSKGRYSLVIPTYVLTFEGILGTFSMSVTSKQEMAIPQKSVEIFAILYSKANFLSNMVLNNLCWSLCYT